MLRREFHSGLAYPSQLWNEHQPSQRRYVRSDAGARLDALGDVFLPPVEPPPGVLLPKSGDQAQRRPFRGKQKPPQGHAAVANSARGQGSVPCPALVCPIRRGHQAHGARRSLGAFGAHSDRARVGAAGLIFPRRVLVCGWRSSGCLCWGRACRNQPSARTWSCRQVPSRGLCGHSRCGSAGPRRGVPCRPPCWRPRPGTLAHSCGPAPSRLRAGSCIRQIRQVLGAPWWSAQAPLPPGRVGRVGYSGRGVPSRGHG